MNRYTVFLTITGNYCQVIEANSEKEAVDKFYKYHKPIYDTERKDVFIIGIKKEGKLWVNLYIKYKNWLMLAG